MFQKTGMKSWQAVEIKRSLWLTKMNNQDFFSTENLERNMSKRKKNT